MPAVENAPKQILVVEDEGLIADDIRRRLVRLGYAVPAIASSGEEALRLAAAQSIDLVLMDIRLNGAMDGIAAAAQLRDTLHLPVVYLTAHADADTVTRATLTEPFGYILKPISDGNLRGTVQIALYKHDIERRLRESEAWLSTTLRSIGEAIVATDASGEIVLLNAVAERLTGWPAAEARGRALMEVLALRDEDSGDAACNPVFDLLPEETRIYGLDTRDGRRTVVEAECFENRDESELLGAIVVVRDVRARRESEERTVQSERMDAIASLAGGMAGDFDALLAELLAQADELYTRLHGEEREHAAGIRHTASRALSLAGQMSALSRRDTVPAETLEANQAIADFRESLAVCLGPKVVIELKLDSPAAFIHAARTRFQQVLIHLALYARDAMAEGGRLSIETTVADFDASDPAARRYAHRWYLRLRATASHAPLDAAALAAVFEPHFAETSGARRFGLAIAHAIVAHAGGHIAASSADGATTFEILWPAMGAHHSVNGLVGRDRRHEGIPMALLIEEEDTVRRALAAAIIEDGCEALVAKSVADGERIAAACSTPVALFVADRSAAPLAERLERRHPRMAALYLSGYRHDRATEPDALAKPFPLPEFRRRVRALLDRTAQAGGTL